MKLLDLIVSRKSNLVINWLIPYSSIYCAQPTYSLHNICPNLQKYENLIYHMEKTRKQQDRCPSTCPALNNTGHFVP